MIYKKTLLDIWQSDDNKRHKINKYRQYYEGKQLISELLEPRKDGRIKTNAIVNWTKHIVKFYSGFLLTNPVQYNPNPNSDQDSYYRFLDINQNNNVESLDTQHLNNCLLYGYSVEVHTFDGDNHYVNMTNPDDWAFVRNDKGTIVEAIFHTIIPKYTYYRDEFLVKDKEIFNVYDSDKVIYYELADKNLQLVDTMPHVFGRLPIVVFTIGNEGEPFVTDAILQQTDIYSIICCAMADDVKHNVDSLLKLVNMDWQALIEKDDDGVSILETLQQLNIFPVVPKDKTMPADASYISRVVDVNKFDALLNRTRQNIHKMADIPDLEHDMGGNISSITGVALKLMFQPLIQQSAEIQKHFKNGLNQRIALYNSGLIFAEELPFVGYDIQFKPNVPQNHIEFLQYAANARNIYPLKEIYRQSPGLVASPEQVLDEYNAEHNAEQNDIQGI